MSGLFVSGLDVLNNFIYACFSNPPNITRRLLKLDVIDCKQREVLDISESADSDYFQLKIAHKSLQPDSNNRCRDNLCPHLCLAINVSHFRCVCRFSADIHVTNCVESVFMIVFN